MAEIIPAILEKDFTEIEKKINSVKNLVKWIQIDMADNTLVPNATFLDPAPFANVKSVSLEAHLMVKEPLKYLDGLAGSGFKRIFAHVEADSIADFIEKGYQLGIEAGLAIDGPTDLGKIREYLDNIDAVLVMAIKAGFSGQPFRGETVDRIKAIHSDFFDLPIAVDGAMDLVNARKVVEAGATRINSNSYIFNSPDIRSAIESLKSLIEGIRSPV